MSHEQLKICKQCSKPIIDTGRYKFCTTACMTAWHDQKKHAGSKAAAPSTRACSFCHKPMSAEAGAYGTYCSELCQRKAAEDNEDEAVTPPQAASSTKSPKLHCGKCVKCAKDFTTKTWPVRKYCSDDCRKSVPAERLAKSGATRFVFVALPPWHHRVVAVAKTLPSRFRRGLAGVLKAAADRLS